MKKSNKIHQFLEDTVFATRWILYPINIGLALALSIYVIQFLREDFHFIMHGFSMNLESIMLVMLGFVDAAMVANLIVMILQGGHQIFISKFNLGPGIDAPQYLDHIDTGILKVKIALSVAGITLVQMLRDFVNIEKMDWVLIQHRLILHAVVLLSALVTAIIWRLTHTPKTPESEEN